MVQSSHPLLASGIAHRTESWRRAREAARATSGAIVTSATTTIAIAALCVGLSGCSRSDRSMPPAGRSPFESDLAFLRQHTHVLLLSDPSGSQVALARAYQGRVLTSTTGGADAPSFGWIGRAAIASGQRQPHMNVFGGEDRFWLGPEGGQFALYFKPGDS